MNDEERVILSINTSTTEVDSHLRPLIEKGYFLAGLETDPSNDKNVVYILRLVSRVKG